MTIDSIKDNLMSKIGEEVRIILYGSRNKKEIYNGKIEEVYNYIFVVKLDNFSLKSFCYSDVLTKVIKLYF